VDYPAWAKLKEVNGLQGGNEVQLMAVDLGNAIRSGSKNVELAKITVKGLKKGSTIIHLHRDRFDDHKENSIKRTLIDSTFTVGDAPVATRVATPSLSPQIPSTPIATIAAMTSPPGPKATYSGTVPTGAVLGIISGILVIGIGGRLRRR
jgi:hypothetical protein